MKHISRFLAALIVVSWGSLITAAEFSPALDEQLQRAQSSEFVSAIVILPSATDIRVLDWKLHKEHARLARRHAEVIAALKENANTSQPAFRAELESAKVKGAVRGYTAYWIENLFVVQATKEFIEALRERGDIEAVGEDFHGEPMEPVLAESGRNGGRALDELTLSLGVEACGAYRVNTELGITGAGTIVGNLDTGVNASHPALASRWRGLTAPWQECWRDPVNFTSAPTDPVNHGTATMGTITGREVDGADTTWTGCAPGALWIADNAINQGVGPAFENDIVDAFQWFADPDGDPETMEDLPDVVSNNWGVSVGFGYPQCYDFWNAVIQNCEAAGPVITWAAGAEGPSGILRSPAIFSLSAEQIFAVGSVDASNYPNAPYPLASWSTHGPTPCTPAIPDNIKPEIVSPAIDIVTCSGSSGYTSYSGASFAEAHVAGIVALMRQACPDCDYITIKQALMTTAVDEGAIGEDNLYGHGFVDAYAAVLAVLPVIDDLTIHPSGNDIVLRWSAAPYAAYYRIYTSATSEEPWALLDSTTATVYTHVNGTADSLRYYYVTANQP
jgi:subtilisin family serine protease